MSRKNTKPFPKLQISDLEKHPIWETLVDDDADDPSVFPIDTLPVTHLTGRLVGTRVKLANGDRLWAMLFNLDLTDARKTDQLVQLRIERKGKWFWLARYWDVDYDRSGPEALATFLGLSVDETFPITYDITGIATGLQPVVSGQLSKEPRQRLPRDEIIRMAVP